MPFANQSAAYDAIMDQFKTQWAILYPVEAPFVVYPDQKQDTPLSMDPWVRLIIQHKLGFQATLNSPGNRRFRAKGSVRVEVRSPLGDGLTQSQSIIDNVYAVFEGQTTGPDAVIFREVFTSEHGPDGVWFLTVVTINFEYDRFR